MRTRGGEDRRASDARGGYAAKTAKQGRIRHGTRLVSPVNHPDVAARKDSRLTIGDIVAKLEQCFNGVIEDRQWSAACQAAMSQAKALGLIVDRKAIGIKPISEMNEAELAILVREDPDSEEG